MLDKYAFFCGSLDDLFLVLHIASSDLSTLRSANQTNGPFYENFKSHPQFPFHLPIPSHSSSELEAKIKYQ